MIDNDLQGTIEIVGNPEKHEYVDLFFNEPELKPAYFMPKLKALSIDIETSLDSKKLYSISLYSEDTSKTLLLSKEKIKNTLCFNDEKSLLEQFKLLIKEYDPDFITGWNLIDFDFDYLKKKFKENKIPFALGRSGEECKISIEDSFFRSSKADFPGRQVLDTLSLIRDPYLKDSPYIRSKKFENYRLETVAKEILGKSKLIDETKNKGEEIDRLYKEDKESLVRYNLNDAKLTYEILKETMLVDLLIERSLLTGMPLDRVNASIASLDSLYIREARKRKLAVPSAKFSEKEKPITGGYVMQSKPGIYDNILVFDFKSLYPSLMRTFNIDPASYLEKKEKGCIESPNKAYFKNTDGILPSILEKLMDARAKAKKEKKELASQAIKITMNSMFGSIASPASRFFNMKVANSITTFGQYFIKLTAEKLEEQGYEVIYSDTDSVFMNPNADSSQKAEKIGREIEEKLNSFYKKYIKEKYKRDSKLELEFEKNYIRFLMPTIRSGEKGAKKKYAGLLIKDGKEKIDFVGVEYARRDWTNLAKKFQLELLDRIFHKKEVSEYVKNFVKDVKDGKYDSLLVYRKAIRKNLGSYRVESQHLKAAKKLKVITSNLIEYVLTTDGPEPIQNIKHKIDYGHYIDKQIKPIADSVLCFYNTSFNELLSKQHSLFDFKN